MNKKLSLNLTFLKFTIFPMVVLGLIVLSIGSGFVARSLNKATMESMSDLSQTFLLGLDRLYPGDFSYAINDDGVCLYKGGQLINNEFDYIDSFKERTGYDITLYYMNYSVLTTIVDKNNKRMVGERENTEILEKVLLSDFNAYYSEAVFKKDKYHAYYMPIHDAEGKPIGMISLFEPVAMFRRLVRNTVIPLIGLSIVATLLGCLYTHFYSKKFINDIKKIQKYMKAIAMGDFKAELGNEVATRTDELGDMGRSATKMASSLRKIVEEDLLTSLLNRRSADKHLKETMDNFINKGVKFCLAMGDIDFFKKVNDTYGHEAGDKVLIAVADTMKNYMIGKGYVIRWGGEEFILVFDGYSLDKAKEQLEELLDKIRALEIVSGDNVICVTMSFGIIDSDPEDMINMAMSETVDEEEHENLIKQRIDRYISDADGRLYYSKQNGRNRITSFEISDTKE